MSAMLRMQYSSNSAGTTPMTPFTPLRGSVMGDIGKPALMMAALVAVAMVLSSRLKKA